MKMFIKTLRIFLVGTLLASSLAFADEKPIGHVVLAIGQPVVERSDKRLAVKRNDILFEKDVLITSRGSRLLIMLKDQTKISLAENTHFELTSYHHSKQKSEADFKMLKGAFRAITGAIGKQDSPQFEVHTPIATIGVRGTDFWGGFIFSEDLDVTMISGKGVYITNEFGAVEIQQPGEGTTVIRDQAPSAVKVWPNEKLSKAAAATRVEVD